MSARNASDCHASSASRWGFRKTRTGEGRARSRWRVRIRRKISLRHRGGCCGFWWVHKPLGLSSGTGWRRRECQYRGNLLRDVQGCLLRVGSSSSTFLVGACAACFVGVMSANGSSSTTGRMGVTVRFESAGGSSRSIDPRQRCPAVGRPPTRSRRAGSFAVPSPTGPTAISPNHGVQTTGSVATPWFGAAFETTPWFGPRGLALGLGWRGAERLSRPCYACCPQAFGRAEFLLSPG